MTGKRKIVLHAGANKTGSTAIQTFLGLNAKTLRDRGFYIPNAMLEAGGHVEGTHVSGIQACLADKEHGRRMLEDRVEAIVNETTDGETILISAENLAAQRRAPDLFAGIAEKHDLSMILYIRRQDEYLLSSWQQWHSKKLDDFWAWLVSRLGTLGHWQNYLENWERVVPRDKITVRIFDRQMLKDGDVISDFMSMLDPAAQMDRFSRPGKISNPSFSDTVVELVKGNKAIFANTHDNGFYNFVQGTTGDRYVRDRRESAITHAQRCAIVEAYAKSNKWVRDAYFPGRPKELFAPVTENEYIYSSSKTLTQRQIAFLVTLLYGMYRWSIGRRKS